MSKIQPTMSGNQEFSPDRWFSLVERDGDSVVGSHFSGPQSRWSSSNNGKIHGNWI